MSTACLAPHTHRAAACPLGSFCLAEAPSALLPDLLRGLGPILETDTPVLLALSSAASCRALNFFDDASLHLIDLQFCRAARDYRYNHFYGVAPLITGVNNITSLDFKSGSNIALNPRGARRAREEDNEPGILRHAVLPEWPVPPQLLQRAECPLRLRWHPSRQLHSDQLPR